MWSDVPANVQEWRERNDRIIVRWTIPTLTDLQARAQGLEPLSGFRIETQLLTDAGAAGDAASEGSTAGAENATESAVFDVTLEDIESQVTASGTTTVMTATVTAINLRPMRLRLQAVNAAGRGRLSEWTPGVPSTCESSEFLTTHLSQTDWLCRACDSDAVQCNGGSTHTAAARSGYQRLPWVAGRAAFAQCPRPESCLSIEDVGTS